MRLLTGTDIKMITRHVGLGPLLRQVTDNLAADFQRCERLPGPPASVIPEPAGDITLRPWTDGEFYSFKYEAHRPENVARGRPTRSSLGGLGLIESGELLLLTDMTLLTAFRNAATAVLGARYLARKESKTLSVLGTGAQSEFLILALQEELPIEIVRYFDPDLHAMMKFARNLEEYISYLEPCGNVAETLRGADIVIAATSSSKKLRLLEGQLVPEGTHVHALADGDLQPDDLDAALLDRCNLVVDHPNAKQAAIALSDLVRRDTRSREDPDQLTVLVSSGLGLQDFSVLRLFYKLSKELSLGNDMHLLAEPKDPKDLFSCLMQDDERIQPTGDS